MCCPHKLGQFTSRGLFPYKKGRPRRDAPMDNLAAAAAVVVTAAAVAAATVVVPAQAVVATAAEQDQQDDDPANVTATETVVIHKNTSKD